MNDKRESFIYVNYQVRHSEFFQRLKGMLEMRFRRHIHYNRNYYTVSLPPQLARELNTNLVDVVVNDSGIHLVPIKQEAVQHV